MIRALLTAAFVLSLSACEKPGDATPVSTEATPREIQWFKGDVDTAFARAKATGKPLYLYWGAVWCPPCQEIRNTVFKSDEFLALTELFIPVYLDGDTAQAQAVGERFGVKGYPTMIVFNPAGDEITRIPGGLDIERYNSVLALSLNELTPTSQLVRTALADPSQLTPPQLTQLAYYSWGQDFEALPDDVPDTLFADLASHAEPIDETVATRFYMKYLVDRYHAHSEETPVRVTAAIPWIERILSSDTLILANWDTIAYWPEVLEITEADDSATERLRTLWAEKTLRLRDSESLSTAERLAGWFPSIYFHVQAHGKPVPADIAEGLKADVAKADRITTNALARQSVINQARAMYQQAGLDEEAKTMLLAELEKSAAPYYFMSSLGAMAEDAGDTMDAINWFRRAWQESTGIATRFQWGASYVRAMVRMTPDDEAAIMETTDALLDELSDPAELFSGRNFQVLRALHADLRKWESDRETGLVQERVDARIEAWCQHQAEGSLGHQNCTGLTEV